MKRTVATTAALLLGAATVVACAPRTPTGGSSGADVSVDVETNATPTAERPDPAAWLDAAIAATQAADSFTMYTQEWLPDSGSRGNCSKEYVDYSTGAYQYILLDLAEPATIEADGCSPELETPYTATVSDRHYPDLSADPSANLTSVIQADQSIQRQYWDVQFLPWQCYRDIVADADWVTVADDDRGLAAVTSAAVPGSCHTHFYVGAPGTGNSAWTFTTDETGRLTSVEGKVPEGVDDATSDAERDGVTVTRHHRDLFTGFGSGHSLGTAVNGMTAADLAALPVTATATTADDVARLASTFGLGD